MTVRLESLCKEDMSCSVSWRITCVGPGGRRTTPHAESGLVPAGEARSWELSIKECAPGDGYAISPPEWSCHGEPPPSSRPYLAR
jgi:hypothetical protein